MQNPIIVYKPIGKTPLEIIMSLKRKKSELADKKISYAGRLDPLAHGILLLLIGDEIRKKEYYLSLKKKYEFEIVFGLTTDTYDLLGYLQDIKIKQFKGNVNLFVSKFVNESLGKHLQKYPPYSSKTVKGKPLFWWARNNRLDEITIPNHEIEIFNFKLISLDEIEIRKLEQKIKNEIALVHGDFRQEMILKRWRQLFIKTNKSKKLMTVRCKIECSSGTYVRGLAEQMGNELGCGGIVIDIKRTHIGNYSLKDVILPTLETVKPYDSQEVNSSRK